MDRVSPDQGMPFSQHYRRRLLQLLLAFTAFFGAVFVVVNFFAARYELMALEFVLTLLVLALLPIVRRTHHLRRWCLCYLVSLYAVTIYALASPVTSITVFIWVMVMPITAHLLLGRWLGGLFSAFYLAVAAGLFLWRFGIDMVVSSPGPTANVLAVTAWSYMFSHFYEAGRERAEAQLSTQALTDSLTGLANRTQLEQAFDRIASAQALPLSLLMLDLDYFKRINDAYGHATGDAVLRQVAETLRGQTRRGDVVFRLGGEEFCVLLPRTDARRARRFAERLRETIEALRCSHNELVLELTASIGVTTTEFPGEQLDPMLHTADQKLYEAKFGGRNRVVC